MHCTTGPLFENLDRLVCPEPSIRGPGVTAAGGIVAGLVSWPLYGTAGEWPQHSSSNPGLLTFLAPHSA